MSDRTLTTLATIAVLIVFLVASVAAAIIIVHRLDAPRPDPHGCPAGTTWTTGGWAGGRCGRSTE